MDDIYFKNSKTDMAKYQQDTRKSDESQTRIDSIIALLMEEATHMNDPNPRSRLFHVLMKVRERVMKIMRTME